MGAKARKPRDVLLTGPVIRARLGVPPRTWARWVESGMPVAKRDTRGRADRFDAVEVLRWFIDQKKGEKAQSPHQLALAAVHAERAKREKRRNEVEEGRLMDVDDVSRILREAAFVIRTQVDALGRVHGQTVAQGIREVIDRAEADWKTRMMATTPKPDGVTA